jgi:plasmid stabilization system protein ParE
MSDKEKASEDIENELDIVWDHLQDFGHKQMANRISKIKEKVRRLADMGP